MDRGRTRRGGGKLALLALYALNEYSRLERKPPVTAALVLGNTLVYLRKPDVIDALLPTIDQVFFNPYLILKYKDLKRFFLSPFYHLDDSHLVFNMLSLIWKGIQLESSMGSSEFASMIATLVAMSQGMTLILAKSLSVFFNYEDAYYNEYAAGFSGVLFAMKVVLNSQSDNYTHVQGFRVPSRFAAWAELIIVQMFTPGVSFLGHLGGILAGVLYLRLKSSYAGPDPLGNIVRGLASMISWPLRCASNIFRFRQHRTSVRQAPRRAALDIWRCPACTFDNSGRLSVCEICGTSRGQISFPGFSDEMHEVSLEELRRRRVQRFGRRV